MPRIINTPPTAIDLLKGNVTPGGTYNWRTNMMDALSALLPSTQKESLSANLLNTGMAGLKLFKAKIGQTLYLYDEGAQNTMVKKLLDLSKRTGELVDFISEGKKVWFDHKPIIDVKKQGSDMYIWSRDYNKVKHTLVKKTMVGDTIEEEIIGTVFKELD